MTPSDPITARCLALTGSFETGRLAPRCWSVIAGDFDGQGISFSCLQWNFGRGTLQPMLAKMLLPDKRPVAARCFGALLPQLESVLRMSRPDQLAWARSIQSPKHEVSSPWASAFQQLGNTPEWLAVATAACQWYFEKAASLKAYFDLTSDRATALLFDCAVQNGGVNEVARQAILDTFLPGWDEAAKMRCIADHVAGTADPRWRKDVEARKLCIANGHGVVHGTTYDVAKEFGL